MFAFLRFDIHFDSIDTASESLGGAPRLQSGNMEALKAASQQKDEELKALRPQAPKSPDGATKEPAAKAAPDGGYPANAVSE